MRKIKIIMGGRKEVITQIPERYIKENLVLYWIDCVCKESVDGWIDYKFI